MRKINIPMDNVVIGSDTIEEHKMQVLNFMNMIYDIAFCGANRGSINPWFNNLKYEISCLRWEKYYRTYSFNIEQHIDALKERVINYQCSEKDWKDVLESIAETFEIEYTLN
jgi:hypothetical protein